MVDMKLKLIKVADEWYNLLKSDGELIASDDEDFQHNYKVSKLSTKNCQAIERGYDLDELTYDFSWNYQSDPNYGDTIHVFKEGFQKALELMGDNVFNWLEKKGYLSDDKDIIKKEYTQQTEWEVEIEMIDYGIGNDEDGRPVIERKPLLDADGCLILKRK